MKHFNISFQSCQQFASEAATLPPITQYSDCLIQVFSGETDRDSLHTVLKTIQESFPGALIIGATTTGEISDGKNFDHSIIVAISFFENTVLESIQIDEKQSSCPSEKMWQPLINDSTKSLIVFSSGFTLNHSQLIKSIPTSNANLIVSGGVAGDNNQLKQTWVIHGNELIGCGAVAVSLSSHSLSVINLLKFNWVPIGKKMTVTHCDGNVIQKLDNTPLLDIYKKYLGEHASYNFPGTACLFPLTMHQPGILTSRIMLNINDSGAGVFTGSYEVGDRVQFAYADAEMLIDNSYLNQVAASEVEGVFVYSCGGRKYVSGDRGRHEIQPLNNIAPNTGFFTYGEFYTSENGSHEVLNNTMTMLLISENNPISVLKDLNEQSEFNFNPITSTLDFSIEDMYHSLSHFTKAITSELQELNNQLEERNLLLDRLSNTDKLTGVYNRHKLDDILEKDLDRATRYGSSFGIILLDVDYFKNVNDTFGHQVGDMVLKQIADMLKTYTRKSDSVGRWGGEEFMVVVPEANQIGLTRLSEELRKRLEEETIIKGRPVTASFGVALYQNETTIHKLVARADEALYQAKRSGRNTIQVAK